MPPDRGSEPRAVEVRPVPVGRIHLRQRLLEIIGPDAIGRACGIGILQRDDLGDHRLGTGKGGRGAGVEQGAVHSRDSNGWRAPRSRVADASNSPRRPTFRRACRHPHPSGDPCRPHPALPRHPSRVRFAAPPRPGRSPPPRAASHAASYPGLREPTDLPLPPSPVATIASSCLPASSSAACRRHAKWYDDMMNILDRQAPGR